MTVVTHHNASVSTDGSGFLLGRSDVKNDTRIKHIGPSGRLEGFGMILTPTA